MSRVYDLIFNRNLVSLFFSSNEEQKNTVIFKAGKLIWCNCDIFIFTM